MEHKLLSRRCGGRNEMGWIQPICSCGWEGRREYAYNNWQHTNVKNQEQEHLASDITLCAGCGFPGEPLCTECEQTIGAGR